MGAATISPRTLPVALPAVVTPTTDSNASRHGGPLVVGLDGTTIPGRTVGLAPTLPGLGATNATMVDLATAERFDTAPITGVTKQVWLSSSPPRNMLARLQAQGVRVLSTATVAASEQSQSRSGVSLAYFLFLLTAIAALVLVIGAASFSLAAGARRRSAELAALRAVGVRKELLLWFLRAEQLLVLGTGVLLGAVAGIVGAATALRSVPELAAASAGPPLDLGLPLVGLVTTVLSVVVALAVITNAGASALLQASTVERLRMQG